MVKVLPAIFSYEDMKSRFAQDNPDDPYTRRADLESGIYELDSWLIRVDDENKAISTVGFKEHPSHTVVGGMYASAKGREIGGNNRALQMAREPQLNQSKPLVAAFGHRDGDNARWIAKAKQNGWKFPEDDGFQQISQLLPEQVVSAWNSAYPNGNWAIRSIRGEGDFAKCVYLDDPTPQWFNLLKWRPDGTFSAQKGDRILENGKYSSQYKAQVTNHYLKVGEERGSFKGFHWQHFDRIDLIEEWTARLREQPEELLFAKPRNKIWFYCVPDKNDYAYVDARAIRPTASEPEITFIFESIRIKDPKMNTWMGAPSYAQFIDIWGTGLKEGQQFGDTFNPFSKLNQQKRDDSIFSQATTSDEVYEIWKKWYSGELESLKKLINKRKILQNEDKKKKTDGQIDRKNQGIRKKYQEYIKYHKRLSGDV